MRTKVSIAAALIDDGTGRLFLVRKRGTAFFMQAGGKIDLGETPAQALVRELQEELGFQPGADQVSFLGRFSAPAANEQDHVLDAFLFHVRTRRSFRIAAELEEGLWVSVGEARSMPLAPFTRDYVLPLAFALIDQ